MAKILTAINFGPLHLHHRIAVLAAAGFADGLPIATAARHVARGGMLLRPFAALSGSASTSAVRFPSPSLDWRALNESVRKRAGVTVAQLARSATATTSDRSGVVLQACRDAADAALATHFDGIELEAPNPTQPTSLLLDLVQILIDVWGPDRVGVQLAPFAWMSGPDDQTVIGTYGALLAELTDMEIAYVHLAGAVAPGRADLLFAPLGRHLRAAYPGILLASGGFTPAGAIAAVEGRWADIIGLPLLAGDGDCLIAAVKRHSEQLAGQSSWLRSPN